MADVLEPIAKVADRLFQEGFRYDNGKVFANTSEAQGLARFLHQQLDLMIPNDWVYSLIPDMLDAIRNGDEPDTYEPVADVYDTDLIKWLSDYPYAMEAVNEVLQEFGPYDTLQESIMHAQEREMRKIFYFVYEYLSALVENEEDEEEEETDPSGD